MDWSKLHRLDVGRGNPHFLYALNGRVPQLQALSFGNFSFFLPLELLDTVTGLVEVTVACFGPWGLDEVPASLFSRHGRTLRKLHFIVSPGPTRWVEWDVDGLKTLVDQCDILHDLAIPVAMEGDSSGCLRAWVNSPIPFT
jgi:hypothetical protein